MNVNYDASLLNYFLNAGIVVKCVMLILVGVSIFSWTYILQRSIYLRGVNRAAKQFEHAFWSGEDLTKLYEYGDRHKASLDGVESFFHGGFKQFLRFRRQAGASLHLVMENTKRAMRVAQMRQQEKLE